MRGTTYKSNRLLANSNPLLINPVDNSRKSRRTRRSATNKLKHAIHNDNNIVANRGDIRVSASSLVVAAALGDALGRVVHAGSAVGLVGGGVLGEVGVDSGVLVGWAGVDVREAAAGGEAGDGDFGVLLGAGAGGEVGGAGGGEVRAGRWEVGVEDFAFAEAAWKIVLAGSQCWDS